MIQQFCRFVKSGAGLEKTLRLIQCTSQVVAALTMSSALAMQLTTVKLQLALSKLISIHEQLYPPLDCHVLILELLRSAEIFSLLWVY